MAHISSLTAVMFSDLSVTTFEVSEADWLTLQSTNAVTAAASLGKLFDNKATLATSTSFADHLPATTSLTNPEFAQITHLKEFPALGTPANIVKVPEYGSKTSKQIQGQADAPSMEITLNYIPSLWAGNKLTVGTTAVGPEINDGKLYVFRFTLLGKDPGTYTSSALGGALSGAAGTDHSCFYFLGKLEALEVTSSLTEALTAKLTISAQSEIKGAYTNVAV
jgi:hypothetical protein